MDIGGLAKMRRPGSSKIRCGKYWFSLSNGAYLKEVDIGISSQRQLFVVEITPVDERIMSVRPKHTGLHFSFFQVMLLLRYV